jgi:hypothetical protein
MGEKYRIAMAKIKRVSNSKLIFFLILCLLNILSFSGFINVSPHHSKDALLFLMIRYNTFTEIRVIATVIVAKAPARPT